MYQDLTFKQLITKADKLAKTQQDFLAPANELSVITNAGTTYMEVEGKHYKMSECASRQLASLISMPYPYMQRLTAEHSDLLDTSINTLLTDINKPRLIRTNSSVCTALLPVSNVLKP